MNQSKEEDPNTKTMPNKLQKSLHVYLSKIKSPHPLFHLPSKKWLLPGCKHHKTPSFVINESPASINNKNNNNNNKNDDAATLADVDRFLIENFKSLYLRDDDDHTDWHNARRITRDDNEFPKLGPISFDESPRFLQLPPDLSSSNRFFVRPGFTSSMVVEDSLTSLTATCDEADSSSPTTNGSSLNFNEVLGKETATEKLPQNCVAVLRHASSPHEEFQRSMQEVVEAKFRNHERVDWDFMQELLFSHLNLNDKKSYKFILNAFVDLIIVLRQRSERAAAAKPRSVRSIRNNNTR